MNNIKLINVIAYTLICLACCSSPVNYEQYHNSPSEISLITSDVNNFWKAYDSVASDTTLNASKVYNEIYFNNASTGLKDFCRIKKVDKNVYASSIFSKYPKYYKSIRNKSMETVSQWSKINFDEFFQSFDAIVPDAKYFDIYFIIGNLSGGGKMTSNGLIISLEVFSTDENTDMSEIDPSFSRILSSFSGSATFESIIIHELVHANQSIENPDRILLNQSIIEGGADFITYLATGTILNKLSHQYGNNHEKDIWQQFKNEMYGNYDNWLYNGLNYPEDEAPDLGYFVGFKICESFYKNAEDKETAIKRILNPNNYSEFLTDSKYNPIE